ncbi:MAG: 50S ribosomal protein L31 [Minisyncoccales bacterium]
MKEKIHPKYHIKAKVECACGNTFEVGSTQDKIEVEICSNCHPFYTKQEKIVDKMGRVEKFKQKMKKSQEFNKQKEKKEKKKKKDEKN